MDPDFTVSAQEAGVRLDKVLKERYPDYSRSYFQTLIENKLVLVNGDVAKKAEKLEEGDDIEIEFTVTPEISLEAEDIPLNILYEDETLIVVDKPPGMVVHPAVGNWSGTFVNALLFHCKHFERGDSLRPGIVHRLDKETSGVMVAAKNECTQQKLVEAFAQREVEKEYRAICLGNPGKQLIEGNIGRHPIRRKEMALLKEGGKAARTACETLAYNDRISYVRLLPETGRTHQLRVHLKSVGCPILGDSVYGSRQLNQKYQVTRQLLHAYRLKFIHPMTKVEIEVKAPIPQDMGSLIKSFKLP